MHAFLLPGCFPARLSQSAVLLGVCGAIHLQAQTVSLDGAPAPPTPAPLYVEPTVTREMGDRGGKYFGKVPDPAMTRRYYIAAEPVQWDFAPGGLNPMCGQTFPASLLLKRVSSKIRYVQYEDANFTARVLPTERLGILGPVLRGTTGDYLAVTFLNRSWRPLSMHPHGVKYDKDSEGAFYEPGAGLGSAVAPGAKFTYVWYLDAASAPLSTEPSSRAWLYHSHVSGDEEINLGLIGSIIVTDPARARPDGTPRDVDREEEALFLIFNEGDGAGNAADPDAPPAAPQAPAAPAGQAWAQAAQAAEENQRFTINGRIFGNLSGLEMNQGERVRWYLFGLGSENDMHTAHWHGGRVIEGGRRTDVVSLQPAEMKVADMVADNPGQWLFHCHVAEHMMGGMFTNFIVDPAGSAGISRDPEIAFLGLPPAAAALRLQSAELSLDLSAAGQSEVKLTGQVTVPEILAAPRTPFTVRVGEQTLLFQPDASGLSVIPQGSLRIKNISSGGVVTGGRLDFEVTLKGDSWLRELERQHLLRENTLTTNATLPVSLTVADTLHTASCVLKLAEH
jgi:FtsP/CotA-like multicopper oxidase with cupredoxin domain